MFIDRVDYQNPYGFILPINTPDSAMAHSSIGCSSVHKKSAGVCSTAYPGNTGSRIAQPTQDRQHR